MFAAIDLDTVTKIATIVGELASAGALVAGFVLYSITKRDEYVTRFKGVMAANRARCHRLNEHVNYELVTEIVRAVVFSNELEAGLQDVYERFFSPSGSGNKEDLEKWMKESFPVIAVPVHTPLTEAYEELILSIEADLAQYQSEFPALFRVFVSVRGYLANAERQIKESARDEELWEKVLPTMYEERHSYPSVNHFKDSLSAMLFGLVGNATAESKRDIDLALALLDLVVDAYLEVPGHGVLRWAKTERSASLIPLKSTKTVTEDLREAEKPLKQLLTQDVALAFREHVARLEA